MLEFGGGYDATVTFYTNANRNKVVDSFAKGDDRTLSVIVANARAVGLSYPVPKSAHWAEATMACAVIPVLTAGEPTCNPDGSASVPFAVTNPDPEWTVVVDVDYAIGSTVYDATVVELAPGESVEGSVIVPPEQTSAGTGVSFGVTMAYPDGSNLQYGINPVVLSDCTPAEVRQTVTVEAGPFDTTSVSTRWTAQRPHPGWSRSMKSPPKVLAAWCT